MLQSTAGGCGQFI